MSSLSRRPSWIARQRPPILALVGASLLSGCLQVRSPRAGEPISLAPGEALAFGRLAVYDRGVPILPRPKDLVGWMFAGAEVKLDLFQVESGHKAVNVDVDDEGRFEWILAEGTYLVYHVPAGPELFPEVLAAFQIGRGDRAVYVGALVLSIESVPNEAGLPYDYATSGFEVKDEAVSACLELADRYPSFDESPVKRIAVTDPELAGLFWDYSRGRCDRWLAEHGLRPIDR